MDPAGRLLSPADLSHTKLQLPECTLLTIESWQSSPRGVTHFTNPQTHTYWYDCKCFSPDKPWLVGYSLSPDLKREHVSVRVVLRMTCFWCSGAHSFIFCVSFCVSVETCWLCSWWKLNFPTRTLLHVKTGAAFYSNEVNVSTLKHLKLYMWTCGLSVRWRVCVCGRDSAVTLVCRWNMHVFIRIVLFVQSRKSELISQPLSGESLQGRNTKVK